MRAIQKRFIHILAIESSCDDSAVCILRKQNTKTHLVHHAKTTLDSSRYGGIVPSEALAHHLGQIAPLTQKVWSHCNYPKIDLVCATRGPGMFSSLAAGLQVGKGLAVAWKVPFVSVHHMLAHLLTPRMFTNGTSPEFPFFSLLVSGGHTMLVLSESLQSHTVLAETIDTAAGNALDRCARYLGMQGNMLGRELDLFCRDMSLDLARTLLPQTFEIPLPLEKVHSGAVSMAAYSFAHFSSVLPRLEKSHGWPSMDTLPVDVRKAIGTALQSAVFQHIARKSVLAIKQHFEHKNHPRQMDFVCAGGVSASQRLRHSLADMATTLDKDGLGLRLHYASPEWCTDNALMIGWAGLEMYEAGLGIGLEGIPLAKWPLHGLSL